MGGLGLWRRSLDGCSLGGWEMYRSTCGSVCMDGRSCGKIRLGGCIDACRLCYTQRCVLELLGKSIRNVLDPSISSVSPLNAYLSQLCCLVMISWSSALEYLRPSFQSIHTQGIHKPSGFKCPVNPHCFSISVKYSS